MKVNYITDGCIVDDIVVDNFDLNKKFVKEGLNGKVSNFVGFLFNKNAALISFPKHFISQNDSLKVINQKINILFITLSKYNASNSPSLDSKPFEYENNIPVNSVINIVKYFNKYGIYRNDTVRVSSKHQGRLNWKQTLNKSRIIVSDGNLIFQPIFRNSKSYNYNLLSSIMSYALFLISDLFKNINYFNLIGEFDYPKELNNKFNYIVMILHKYNNYEFKDINKKLIISLINFFESYSQLSFEYKLCTFNFNIIWEDAVSVYINKFFEGFNILKNEYEFSKGCVKFKKESFIIDESDYEKFISIDHFGISDDFIYIFDSKYYNYETTLSLDYKQVSYSYFVSQEKKQEFNKIKSALLLPTSENQISRKNHLNRHNIDGLCIDEIYLPMREVLESYNNS